MRKIVLGLLGVLSCSLLFAHGQITVYSNADKPILVQKTQPEMTLKLPGNPTTGFSWFLQGDYPQDLIEPKASEYIAPDKQSIGEGGYWLWHFKLKSAAFRVPQAFVLNMLYLRPWEKESAKSLSFTIRTTRQSS